ncbi:MAG: uroporphyrinogen-III C-methyltransferase [Pseudomonadota bacterium]
MSEATPGDARPVLDAPLPPPVTPTTPPAATPVKARGTGLALLALVLGAAALALAGWAAWQLRGLEMGERQQLGELEAVRAQTRTLSASGQRLDARLAQLPSAEELADRRRLLGDLQSDQQRLNQRLEGVLGASRQAWRLAEAEHLLRLASLRLSALQDVDSARALVQGADQILRDQDDPAAFAAREQLARSLAALRSVDQPDRTGLFLQLGALREQVAGLNAATPAFVAKEEAAVSEGRWARWWQQISGFVRIDFDAEQNIQPLLTGQSLSQVRLALSLALEQAQWAVLNGETQVYRQALVQARSVLGEHFDLGNPQVRALGTRLDELGELPVAVDAPDLAPALSAVQAYLQRRETSSEPEPALDAEDSRP